MTPSANGDRMKSVASVVLTLVTLTVARQVGVYFTTNKGDGSTTDQVKTYFSSDQMKEYNSPEYGFKVNFPGFPQQDTQNIDVQGYNVPGVMYSRSIDNDNKLYAVYVWDYSGLPIESNDLSAESGLNGMIGGLEGSKLTSSAVTMIDGYSGLRGTASVPAEGKEYDAYIAIAIKGKKAYGLLTLGESEEKYKEFERSFRFL